MYLFRIPVIPFSLSLLAQSELNAAKIFATFVRLTAYKNSRHPEKFCFIFFAIIPLIGITTIYNHQVLF